MIPCPKTDGEFSLSSHSWCEIVNGKAEIDACRRENIAEHDIISGGDKENNGGNDTISGVCSENIAVGRENHAVDEENRSVDSENIAVG